VGKWFGNVRAWRNVGLLQWWLTVGDGFMVVWTVDTIGIGNHTLRKKVSGSNLKPMGGVYTITISPLAYGHFGILLERRHKYFVSDLLFLMM
jgi:hypothetical protein